MTQLERTIEALERANMKLRNDNANMERDLKEAKESNIKLRAEVGTNLRRAINAEQHAKYADGCIKEMEQNLMMYRAQVTGFKQLENMGQPVPSKPNQPAA